MEREAPSKVRVWTKKPKESYKYKYSWLPQPMLSRAAMSVYKDNRERTERGAPPQGLQEEHTGAGNWREDLGERSVMSNISNSLTSLMSIVSPEKKKKSVRRSPSPKSKANGQSLSPGRNMEEDSLGSGSVCVKSKGRSKKKLHPEAFH